MVKLLGELKICGVCLNQFQLYLLFLCVCPGLSEHAFGQVQTGHGDPVFGQGDGMPAGPATNIQDTGSGCQSKFVNDEFYLEISFFGKYIFEVIGRMSIKKAFPLTFFHKVTCLR